MNFVCPRTLDVVGVFHFIDGQVVSVRLSGAHGMSVQGLGPRG